MTEVKKSATFLVQHVLQIDDVQKRKKEKATVKSAKFKGRDDSNPVPGEFTLEAYFGSIDGSEDHLSVFVRTNGKGTTFVSIRISIIDLEGSLLGRKISVQLTKTKTDCGFKEVLALNSIKARKMAILCHLQYVPYKSIPEPVNNSTIQLQSDYIAMFESGSLTDVTFVVQGEEVAAHRLVLSSRSDYFKKMFEAGMQESTSKRVEVPDMDVATFKAMLRFVYGGVMEEKKFVSLAGLIVAADKYGLDELKKICEFAIRSDLYVENVIDALLIADTANCPLLLRDAKVLFKALPVYLKRDLTKWNKLATRPFLLLQLADTSIE